MQECATNQGFQSLVISNDFNNEFCYYLMQTKKLELITKASGSTFIEISNKEVKNISCLIPIIQEQQKIASFLTLLDKRIAKQRELVESLKSYKRGLLSRLFPQNGESEPRLRFSGHSGVWRIVKIGEIGSVSMCKRIFKEQTSPNGDIPFYKIGTFGGKEDSYISRSLFEEYKSKYPYPKNGDILLSASGSIGRTVVYRGKDEYFQDSNIVWVNHDDSITNNYLKQLYNVIQWTGIEGSTIKRLYNDNILNTYIPLPKLSEQNDISRFLNQFDEQISQNENNLLLLESLKSSMVQNLFI